MNEPLFECTYTDSEELLYESYRYVRCRQQVRLGLFCLVAAICVFALSIWLKYDWNIMCALLLTLGVYMLLYPKILAHRMMKTILRANGGSVPSARLTVTDRITHHYKLDTTGFFFSDVVEVYFLRQSIVIVGKDGYLTFDADSFTKGSAQELEAFLQEKCPEAVFFHKRPKETSK